jgi:hypothetical protein
MIEGAGQPFPRPHLLRQWDPASRAYILGGGRFSARRILARSARDSRLGTGDKA